MSAEEFTLCKSRLCIQLSAGIGPISGLNLCQEHLEKELQKVKTMTKELIEKLRIIQDTEKRQTLRAEQSSLEAELQEVSDMFDVLQDKVQQWRDKVVSRVQAAYDSVARRLRDAAEADDCEKEVMNAFDAGEMRKVMELTVSIESWLDEARHRSNDFDRSRAELLDRQSRQSNVQQDAVSHLRSVGDVSGGVQQLQFVIDRHMTDVMQQCWLDDKEVSAASSPVYQFTSSINNLPGYPLHVTSCSNTAGFVGDASGRVIRVESDADDLVPLPQPCIITGFQLNTCLLLATSVNGNLTLHIDCNFHGHDSLTGLHCDSKKQFLYVAQCDSVTVMDLSGQTLHLISGDSLGQTIGSIGVIDGNSDKLFMLDTENCKVLIISKDPLSLQSIIDLSFISSINATLNCISLCGRKLLVSDSAAHKVYKVCSISGHLIMSYPTQRSEIHGGFYPWHTTSDSRGVIIVSELLGHTVRIMTSDGMILQTLGTSCVCGSSEDKLDCPSGIALVETERTRLVVADCENKRLCVFEML